jgi:hypothetical protein
MADDAVIVLERAKAAGLTVSLDGLDLKVQGQEEPTPQTKAVLESLKEHKSEVVTYLSIYGDGQPPPLDRPIANEPELRRWMDWTADPERFARWIEWAMTDESTNY